MMSKTTLLAGIGVALGITIAVAGKLPDQGKAVPPQKSGNESVIEDVFTPPKKTEK